MFTDREIVSFKGLMAPVFTPMGLEEVLNCDLIPKYGKHLADKGIRAVLVNGTSGEGPSLTIEERKEIVTVWKQVCKEHKMLMMVQIGGGPMNETVELAKQCATLAVDAVLCLPDHYFKPKTIDDLLDYIVVISFNCQNCPIYYYHIPSFSGVDLPMDAFMELATRQLPAFAGIKYTSGDLEMGIKCLKYGQVFLGADTIWAGALALGFDCAILTSLNIWPEYSMKIFELMGNEKVKEARDQQKALNKKIKEALSKGKNLWVPAMKKAFNVENIPNLDLGRCRRPIRFTDAEWKK